MDRCCGMRGDNTEVQISMPAEPPRPKTPESGPTMVGVSLDAQASSVSSLDGHKNEVPNATLKIGVFTWNVGNKMMDEDVSEFVAKGGGDYDILAFGCQECEYSGGFPIKVPFTSGISTEEPEYLTTSKKGTGKWHHFFAVVNSHLGAEWAPVESENLLEMRLIVFARKRHAGAIRNTKVSTEATGLLGLVGNKGGIIVRFYIYDTSIAFVSCHLAAHEGIKFRESRNANVDEVLNGGARVGEVEQLDIMTQTHHTFWMGDLNYRLDPYANGLVPEPSAADKKADKAFKDKCAPFPASETEPHRAISEKIRSMIDQGQYAELAKHDELRGEIARGEVLSQFREGDITFAPTFKVVPRHKYEKEESTQGKDPDKDFLNYTYQRWPAFCDRVLWASRPHCAHAVSLMEYTALPKVMSSDHKPVKATFSLNAYAAPPPLPQDQPAGAPEIWLSNVKGASLKATDISGSSDPYLFFWCPEIGVTNEGKHGWDGNSTTHKTQTLEPSWEETDIPTLHCMTADIDVISKAHLVISIVDHDLADADDDMGCIVLPLADFVDGTGVDFEQDVLCNGVKCGKLSGHMKLSWPEPDGKRAKRTGKSGGCRCIVM